MQCGCRVCGKLTNHVEQGLDSYCVCSDCGWQCRMCMGGQNKAFQFLDRDSAKRMKEDTEIET